MRRVSPSFSTLIGELPSWARDCRIPLAAILKPDRTGFKIAASGMRQSLAQDGSSPMSVEKLGETLLILAWRRRTGPYRDKPPADEARNRIWATASLSGPCSLRRGGGARP